MPDGIETLGQQSRQFALAAGERIAHAAQPTGQFSVDLAKPSHLVVDLALPLGRELGFQPAGAPGPEQANGHNEEDKRAKSDAACGNFEQADRVSGQ
ncbi:MULTISPECIES: hypothetical protein [unclassified Beijerinckia]|uniref:hypothetical protein n=1 Tax=unclassified Beijerinckia TaxID=2638183 RepID=UPI001FCD9AAC|nr:MULTISPECIES: hypothetical protein [unclassified Beijerinckia]